MQTTGFTIEINGVEKYLKDFNELQKAYKDNLKTLKEMEVGTEEYYEQRKVVAQLKNGVSDFNAEIRKQANEFKNIDKGVGTYKKLEQETRKLKNESKELAAQLLELEKAGKDNTDEYKQLRKSYEEVTSKAQEYDETLKSIDETVGDSFRNVGNYKSAFTEAMEESGIGVEGLNSKFNLLRANPLILVVTALVGAFKLLFDAFKRSKTGAEFMNKASGVLKGVMAVLTNVVSGLIERASNLGTSITNVFKNPKQALLDFKDMLVENIQNRIEGLLSTFGYLGDTIKYIFSGDFKKASESAGEAAKSMAQTVTGASKETIDGIIETVKETTKAYTDLEVARMNTARANAALTKEMESMITAYELEQQKADDATLSLIEQEAAAEKSMQLKEKLAAKEIQIARNNLALIQTELALRKKNKESTDDLLEAEASAFSELKAAERDLTLTVKDNARQRREIKRDALERELDFLIDGFDKQKTINETLIKDENLTYEQRRKLLDETVALANKSYREQEAIFQSFTDAKVDLDELVMESDAKVQYEKVKALKVDDVVTGRIFEAIRERKQILTDFSETEKEINAMRIENNTEVANLEIDIAEQVAEIKYAKGLITQQEFNELSLENDLERLEAEKKILKDKESLTELQRLELLKIEQDIELKKLEIKAASIEREFSLIEKKYEREEDKLNGQFLKGEITEKEHEERLKLIREDFAEEKMEFIKENADSNLEFVQEMADEEIEVIKDKNARELEAEKEKGDKRVELAREITGRLRSISDGLFQTLIQTAEENSERQLELQRKQFNVNKAFNATDSAINSYAAFTSALKTYGGSPLAFIIPPLILAQGLAQVAAILSEPMPMAEGGFTGRGQFYDDTGERAVGIFRLHEGEYVAPRRQVESMPNLFNQLENNRRTGAAVLSPNTTNSDNGNKAIVSAIQSMVSNITVVADSEEIIRKGNDRLNIKKSKVI